MIDPLAQVVGLLRPSASFSKAVEGAGAWRIRRTEDATPFYCAILEGACRLTANGEKPITLQKGDFGLIPGAYDFSTSSLHPKPPKGLDTMPTQLAPGRYRMGDLAGPTNVRMLVGYCAFGSPDAALLVSLLPNLIHIRGESRLTRLVTMVDEESRADRPARDVILTRLIEILLIEALRSTSGPAAPPGLLQGLADDRLSIALRLIHEHPAASWTVVALALEAGLSRSAFFDRFRRAVGIAPMEYLLQWRMALAKDLLRRREGNVAEVAERVGYSSASTFSVAFTRHVGTPPAAYARGRGTSS